MTVTAAPSRPLIVYPESDGKPMADNTKQARWIVLLYTGLAGAYQPEDNVFVAANVNWYPVEGEPDVVCAPDVLVAFGRPMGDRSSYVQCQEGNVAPQVVFEILSPGNDVFEMADKLQFYDDYGVEEYYLYDPEENHLAVYGRGQIALRLIRPAHGHVSRRLGIRFDLSGDEMKVFGRNGRRFMTPLEIAEMQERDARHETALVKADRVAELGRKLRAGTASEEELREFDRITAAPGS